MLFRSFRLFLPCTHLSHLSHSAVAVLYRFIVHDFPTPSSSYANTLIFVNTSPYTPPLLVLVTLFYANPSPVVIGPYLTFRHRHVGVLTYPSSSFIVSSNLCRSSATPFILSSLPLRRFTRHLSPHLTPSCPPVRFYATHRPVTWPARIAAPILRPVEDL